MEMPEFNTLEAATGFILGCAFMGGVVWKFIVVPEKAKAEKYQSDLMEMVNKILVKSGVFGD